MFFLFLLYHCNAAYFNFSFSVLGTVPWPEPEFLSMHFVEIHILP